MLRKSAATGASISNLESRISNHSVFAGSFAALELRWTEVVSRLQQGDPLLGINVLVGSNILATYLKRRYAQTGRALANVRFLNFLDLATRLAGAPAKAGKKLRLPGLGNSILLEDILASQPPDIFAPLSGFPGFRDALLDTFRDLRDAGIDPHTLARFVESGSGVKDRRQHLTALAELYRAFRERVGLYHEVDDDFRAAIRAAIVNAPEAPRALGSRQLLVYGIYDATGQQSQLLAALKDAFEMIYFIPYVDESVSEFARSFLDARVRELGVPCVRLEETGAAKSLEHLAVRKHGLAYYSETGDSRSLAADGSFALVSAPGESRSAIEVVREIFRAVRDGTIHAFYEAAVILRQPENDIPILCEAFRLRGVPYFIHGGSSFSERPISRAVVAISKLEPDAFSRESILTAMELVAASLSDDAASSWDVQSWRSLTNDPRFLAGVPAWNAGTDALLKEMRRKLRQAQSPDAEFLIEDENGHAMRTAPSTAKRLETAESLLRSWEQVRTAASGWPDGLTWREWADFLNQRLEPLLSTSIDWPAFSAVIDDIGNLQMLGGFEIRDSRFEIRDLSEGAGQRVPVERVRGVLAQSLASMSYPEGRFQRSGVNLLSTSAARGLRFPLVIIPGLDEGRFPAKLRQDPLLFDSERRRLEPLPLKSKRIEEERMLFDMAARSAEKRLVLITSRLDESSDRERVPSQFFLRAAAAIRGRAVSMRDLADVPGFRSVSLDNPAPSRGETAVDEGEIRLRLITADRDLSHLALNALEQIEPDRFTRPLAYDRSRFLHRLTSYDGVLADGGLRNWIAHKLGSSIGQVSASRLEEYTKCPYYFFLKRGMELPVWEELVPMEAMDPLERGTLVHSILESFLREHGGEKFVATPEDALQRSLAALAQARLDKEQPAGIPLLLWDIERDALMAILRNWLSFEKARTGSGLRTVRLEQAFGQFKPQDAQPAFRVCAGKHTFDFRGRIDRVDVSCDGMRARVTDYKTGSLPDSMAKKTRTPLMSGERIQLVVYRGALSVLEEFRRVEAVEAEYLHLQPKDGQIVACRFTDEELRAAAKALPRILEVVGDGIENGAFFIRTSGMVRPNGHCEYCDYLPICGKDRIQREERKAGDSAVLKFMTIVESPQ
jgi:ATP-dependent helicase/nuclease subunit B